MRTILTLFIGSLLLNATAFAQSFKPWNANWISAKGETGKDYGVFYFRKQIDLSEKPSAFKVKVSADNRYKLFVNGTLISLGPARGDIYFWNYEEVDLAPYLVAGKNMVWRPPVSAADKASRF